MIQSLYQSATMSLRYLILSRSLSTSRVLHRPKLSAAYKSKQLWDSRFNCNLLGSDSTLIKIINNKITSGVDLTNLEIDVFINIAAPKSNDVSQLQEAVTSLRRFRKTINANTLLPSTAHATCRLFLDTGRLTSLVNLLERRTEFGIFPDAFSLNLLFDRALEEENYAIAARLGALIMLQEEFGLNKLNDNFALYSVGKYIESKTDFSDWLKDKLSEDDAIFTEFNQSQDAAESADKSKKVEEKSEQVDEDEEEEEEAEYIRIPFLRNPYFDNHFDLTNPRSICGKTLSMLGQYLSSENDAQNLATKCKLVGSILEGRWSEALTELDACKKFAIPSNQTLNDALAFYTVNLHDIQTKPSDSEKESILNGLGRLPKDGKTLSEEAEVRHETLRDFEKEDIEQLRTSLENWSTARHKVKKMKDDIEDRKKLIDEIRAKKEELKLKEQYLYFYDNLKKSNLTRIEYN